MIKSSFLISGTVKGQGRLTIKGYSEQKGSVDISLMEMDSEPSATILGELIKQALMSKTDARPLVMEHAYLSEKLLPVLCCYPDGISNAPAVLFTHGLGANKAMVIKEAIQLAQAGFFTIIMDAGMHGERQPEDFTRLFERENMVKSFFSALLETAGDISLIIDQLRDDRRIDAQRIGMSGISMGGFITFLVVVKEKRIRAAAPLIGSPDWSVIDEAEELPDIDDESRKILDKDNPIMRYKSYPPTALLIQNGVEDKIVPISGVRKLNNKLKSPYSRLKGKYRYIEYPGVGHEVIPQMMDEVIGWFKTHLESSES